MTVEENKALVMQYHERMNKGDISVIDDLFTASFILHRPSSDIHQNREEFKQNNIVLNNAFPDSSRVIDDIIAEVDKVSIRETIRETQTGKYGNINPTGKVIVITRFIIFRLENSKIAELWFLSDTLSLFQQLGALPSTEEIGK